MDPNNTNSQSNPGGDQQASGGAAHDASTSTNIVMAVLAYLGILVIVSYLAANKDPFVNFHIKQGLVLFVIEIIVYFVGSMVWVFWPFLQIVNLIILVLAIIGIVNAVKKQQKELPIVGHLASHFKI